MTTTNSNDYNGFDNDAQEQAAANCDTIAQLLAAVACDYDRLEELTEERAFLADEVTEAAECVARHNNDVVALHGPEVEHSEYRRALSDLMQWDTDNLEELQELQEAAGECTNEDDAREQIENNVLSVEVRTGWITPGEEYQATEFKLLLCAGGPHVEIVGELNDYNEPVRAAIYYQEAGISYREYHQADRDQLLEYAAHFCYGE